MSERTAGGGKFLESKYSPPSTDIQASATGVRSEHHMDCYTPLILTERDSVSILLLA